MSLRDLKGGELVSGEFVVREKSLRDFSNKPGRYLTLVLADETDQIDARAWDNAETFAERSVIGEVVFIQGQAEEYRGKVQIKIVTVEARPNATLSKFIPALTEIRIDALSGKLKALIATVCDRHFRALLEKIFGDKETWRDFCTSTAARALHSAYLGGLLEHTVNVATICDAISGLYPEINRDLLITAAILHDIGKLDTYHLQGANFEFTDEGKLLGEPVLGEKRLAATIRTMPGFPTQYHLLLSHLLLSHHGKYEYGAPVLPSSLEAFVLHHADDLEAKANGVLSIMKKEKDPEKVWSDFQRVFDRSIYLSRLESDDAPAGG